MQPIRKIWRPLAALTYLVINVFDFIIFPIFWSILQLNNSGDITHQWQPITLHSGGLFHVAFGAILGATAYGRSREKIAQIERPNPNYSPHQD